MKKLIAVINVIAWSGFWPFGYLAVTSEGFDSTQVLVATLLAGAGFLTGVWAYVSLSRGHKINNKAMGFTHPTQEG